MPLQLDVIVASTRPGRVGVHVGRWFHEVAREHSGFETHWIDLAEVGLRLSMNRTSAARDYQHEHPSAGARLSMPRCFRAGDAV